MPCLLENFVLFKELQNLTLKNCPSHHHSYLTQKVKFLITTITTFVFPDYFKECGKLGDDRTTEFVEGGYKVFKRSRVCKRFFKF